MTASAEIVPDREKGAAANRLQITNVSKTFGGTLALNDVSFEVPGGTVHALCGENGSGKSTLIKILAGVHQADSGQVGVGSSTCDASRITPTWGASVGLHFVHQSVGTFPELSVAENFALGSTYGASSLARISWASVERRTQAVLDRMEVGVSARTKMGALPPSTQTMVAVARALQGQSDDHAGILILDEPTASLHPREAETVLGAIRGYVRKGHSVLLVTHRLHEVLEVCDAATFLRDGRHIETRTMQGVDHRYLIGQITGGHGDLDLAARGTPRSDETCLELRDYRVGALEGISLRAAKGEILGLSGLVGAGQAELLRSLFGGAVREGGAAILDGQDFSPTTEQAAINRGVGYVPADRAAEAVFPELPITRNLSASRIGSTWRRLMFQRSQERKAAAGDIAKFKIATSSELAPISTLSGGNQQKVVLARWLGMNPRLLLLDEPTQGVDVGARAAIHRHIQEAAATGVTVLVASSDTEELAELCHRVVGVWQGRIRGEAFGAALTSQRCMELAYGIEDSPVDSAGITEMDH